MIKFDRFLPVILALIFSLTPLLPTPATLATTASLPRARKNPEAPGSNSRKLLNAYQGLLTNKNVDAILELYSADPVFMPEYAPPAVAGRPCAKLTSGYSRT